jgi:hypothetical protein
VMFRALIMDRMSGRSLAWHWHLVWGYVHLRNQNGIVCPGGLLLRFNWVSVCYYSFHGSVACPRVWRPLKVGVSSLVPG